MSINWPWDVSSAIKARGGRIELTADRTGFHVRGTEVTPEERAWIAANRPQMLNHAQHLNPPESFRALQRSGALRLERRNGAKQ